MLEVGPITYLLGLFYLLITGLTVPWHQTGERASNTIQSKLELAADHSANQNHGFLITKGSLVRTTLSLLCEAKGLA